MWPVGWRVLYKLRTVVNVAWMGVWSGCQVNVRNESYIPRRWFSDNPGFQQVDEKLYYSNSAAVAEILFGVKLPPEYYLISKSKHQVLIDGMKLLNRVDFLNDLLKSSIFKRVMLRHTDHSDLSHLQSNLTGNR